MRAGDTLRCSRTAPLSLCSFARARKSRNGKSGSWAGEASGDGAAEYAKKHGWNPRTLTWWGRRLAKKGRSPKSQKDSSRSGWRIRRLRQRGLAFRFLNKTTDRYIVAFSEREGNLYFLETAGMTLLGASENARRAKRMRWLDEKRLIVGKARELYMMDVDNGTCDRIVGSQGASYCSHHLFVCRLATQWPRVSFFQERAARRQRKTHRDSTQERKPSVCSSKNARPFGDPGS